MPPNQPKISILNTSSKPIRKTPIRAAVETVFERHPTFHQEVTVLLTTDEELQAMNAAWRGIQAPTDVLTFDSGDIAISVDAATRQARHFGHRREEELQILALHGALHLAGFDDESEEDYQTMLAEMQSVALELGIAMNSKWETLEVPPAEG